MTHYTLSALEIMAGSERRPSFGQRLLVWFETHQQRRADRKFAEILRRVRN